MIPRSAPEPLFVVAWGFAVRPKHQSDFERAYGPNGDWVRLFRTGDGYIRTELHRDPNNPGRYITLDFWCSREQYESFREVAKAAYQEIDARCERLTEDERLLGDFAGIASLHAALPQLGAETVLGQIFTIRAVTPNDVPEMIRLEQSASSAAHWTQAAYETVGRHDAPVRIALVSESADRKLSGFVIARIAADQCELENIVVSASESRRGIGSALLRELAQAARQRGAGRIFLEVRESNLPARGLYEKLGFARDGERAAYYSDPVEKAILYSLTL